MLMHDDDDEDEYEDDIMEIDEGSRHKLKSVEESKEK